MSRTTRTLRAFLLAFFVWSLPAVACAGDVLVDRRVDTISGAQMALAVVEEVRSVEVGSKSATVTIETAGGPRDVVLGFADLVARDRDPITGVAVLALAGSAALRGAALVSRLFR